MTPKVLESAEFIARESRDVAIPDEAVRSAAKKLYEEIKSQKYSKSNWRKNDLHPQVLDTTTVDWIVVLDTLNFSFWSNRTDGTEFAISYKGKRYNGYWLLCAAINRALDEGIPITTPSFYANITDEQVRHIFRSDTDEEVPLLPERAKNLREVGTVLMQKFEGSFINCIEQAQNSAQKLLDIVTSSFSCFNDVATFGGREVHIQKRSQILIADLWACFEGEGYGRFDDVETLTMFADYRVPQGLAHLGLLSYSPQLLERMRSADLFQPGERLEVEIRGCSIWAVELLTREVLKLREAEGRADVEINSVILDFYIWDYSKRFKKEMDHIPIHKIRSIFY
eukprot:Colp12_sorted_trinity150504_noHs@10485